MKLKLLSVEYFLLLWKWKIFPFAEIEKLSRSINSIKSLTKANLEPLSVYEEIFKLSIMIIP